MRKVNVDVNRILALGYPAKLDLLDAGDFEIDRIVIEDDGATIFGTWITLDGERYPDAVLGVAYVRDDEGIPMPPRSLYDIFKRGWEDWGVGAAINRGGR